MKNFLIIAFYCLMLLGCKKKDIDYRTKFTGDYNFVIHRYIWAPYPYKSDTTYITSGKIETYESRGVLISFFAGNSTKISEIAKIYEDGTLESYYNKSGYGEFLSTKEMIYVFGWFTPGSQTNYTITGTKKQ